MRRAFRVGIRIGLLAGIVAAVAKMLQSRRNALAPDDGPDPWADRSLRPTPEPVPTSAPAVSGAPAVATAPEAAEPIPATAPVPASGAPADPAGAPTPVDPATIGAAADTTPKKAAPAKAAAKSDKTKKTAKTKKAAPRPAWVEPDGNTCPTSHPIKAKLSSKLFHLPGMFAYDRTNPDRCYHDEAAAEGDGLTRAKR